MNIFKKISLLLVLFIIFSNVFAQEYGPKNIKPYDVKTIKGKTLLIPEYDDKMGFVKVLIAPDAFKEFKTEKEKNAEYKRRWDSALKTSTYDLTPYTIKWFNITQLEKDNDKQAMCMYFESDFYNNWYVYLKVMEPKPMVVATAPINNFDLSKISDIKLMMNILAYQMIKSSSFYGDDAKSLYKDHQYRYKKSMEAFADTIRHKTFLFTRYDKERKNFKKQNDKLNEYMKINWKLSGFDFLTASEVNRKVASRNSSDYYLKSIPVHTSNQMMTYNYFLILTASNNDIIYTYMGGQYLTTSNLKYFQINCEKWLHYFMSKRVREKYTFVSNVKEQTKQTSSPTNTKTKQAKQPEKTAPPKTTAPKTTETKTKEPKTKEPKTKETKTTTPPKIQQTKQDTKDK